MRNFLKITLTLALFVVGQATVKAQQTSTATATASATIVSPISITNQRNLQFGSIAVSSTTGGTVVVSSSAGTRSATGGVSLPANSTTTASAQFQVTGESGLTYAITLPTSVTIDDDNSHTMTVGSFESTPSATGTLTGGSETLSVGATLTVGAAQAVGTYTSDVPFEVTVNYN